MTKIKNFFKNITNSKKKIFALALSVCVVVLSIASSSIAYFTDTAKYTNTFTSGKVDITLTVNGEVIDTSKAYSDADVYPGQEIDKLTSINNKADSKSAFIGAIITVKAPENFLNDTSVKALFKELSDADRTITVGKTTAGGVDTFSIYVVYTDAVAAGNSVQVFSDIVIPSTWNTTEMSKFTNVSFDVIGYAVQVDGFADADTALQAAFTGAFNNMP